ncbi:MAG: hypothetical protein AAGF78_10190 [Pseudomonadota bacterium]
MDGDTRLDSLKREAKRLQRAHERGERQATLQTRQWLGEKAPLKRADFLHAVARERGFESWPKLKVAVEAEGYDLAQARARLVQALFFGQKVWVERLLAQFPDIARGQFHLACALYDVAAVDAALAQEASLATKVFGRRSAVLHLCFSRYHTLVPERADQALAVARLLIAAGADVNDTFPESSGSDHRLSALYGASGHACHMGLTQLLLEAGANPNDNESLYHATEQRDRVALALLLQHGARPGGTNAPFRAMDFDDVRAVEMLIDAGWDPNEGISEHPSGPAALGLSAVHHAVQRGCGAPMIRLLAARGARLDVLRRGLGAYALARLYGNDAAADALAELGASQDVPDTVAALRAGAGPLNVAELPDEVRGLVAELASQPERLPRVKELIAAGLEWDRADRLGLTPVQVAGWNGLPEMMAYFLALKPDLSHVNGFGGTLLSTIIHGSENAPDAQGQDHVACLELALREGVALPRPAIRHAGREDVVAFLEEWGERYPGQVVEHGIA